jgi:wyosine [tRNA(Phe)-imidazoG37] synthetase (radical SAM superfamily)
MYYNAAWKLYKPVKLSKKYREGKKIMAAAMQYVFGPVHSRRLGLSLGIDPVHSKTCTLDCVYCQLGATAAQTLERRAYVPADAVVDEVRQVIDTGHPFDYSTFSGTGEPTLNSELGRMISGIKAITDTPVAVITNSSLLHLPEVRADLMQADLVIPSVNAVSADVFARLSRPLPGFELAVMLQGLERFSRAYPGRLWIEVMLVRGVNDGSDELHKLARFVDRLACEKIQINTVTRPPAQPGCAAVSDSVLERARHLLGPRAEIIGLCTQHAAAAPASDAVVRILALVRSHPCTLAQLCATLGFGRAQAEAALQELLGSRTIEAARHGAEIFYRASGR